MPDAAGERAAQRILDLARGLGPEDQLVFLASGGGSALLSLAGSRPHPCRQAGGDARAAASGATISEINTVRKHLSAIKGGRLAAAAAPARIVTLAISDVPGDDPAVIASGPTVPDPTTFADARAVLEKYRIIEPKAVVAHLLRGAAETPKPEDPIFARAKFELIASPQGVAAVRCRRCVAAEDRADRAERSDRGRSAPGRAGPRGDCTSDPRREISRRRPPDLAPRRACCRAAETTVTVVGKGRGGRNVEFLLALAVALNGIDGISALACDTDGIDGTEDNAGAIVYPDSLARAAARGISAPAALADNDGYGFFAALGDLVMTGPTLTNVNDFRAVLVLA